jgi:GT2 family glycosyltransferase
MKWLQECLESVFNSSIPVTVIIVDNNSTDNSVAYIKENYNKIVLFEQKTNLGFGKANNIGMAYALNQNADFVFLLNQDAFVESNTIEKLIEVSCQNPQFAIVSPIQLDYSGNFLETYFYNFMNNCATKSFYSDFVLSKTIREIYEVPFIQAASWLLPIDTLKKIGGFDPVFFHYGEDDNYCQRVLYHKMKIGVASGIFIRHDSNVRENSAIALFSEAYFKNYEKQLYVKYGNLNTDFSIKHIERERKKTFKLIITGCVSFNFFKIKGGFKQLKLLNNCANKINRARKINSLSNANYIR